jgi:hypothetical protein
VSQWFPFINSKPLPVKNGRARKIKNLGDLCGSLACLPRLRRTAFGAGVETKMTANLMKMGLDTPLSGLLDHLASKVSGG